MRGLIVLPTYHVENRRFKPRTGQCESEGMGKSMKIVVFWILKPNLLYSRQLQGSVTNPGGGFFYHGSKKKASVFQLS
jgi:hypothetical protein